jgi:hypothetical protein
MTPTADLVRVPTTDTDDSSPDPATVARLLDAADEGPQTLHLGVWWAGVHFLLSGEGPLPRHEAARRGIAWNADSLENALMGGVLSGYEDALGGVRYLDPATVTIVAQQLTRLTGTDLAARYDTEALTDERIPPGPWTDLERGHLLRSTASLTSFYRLAAANGDGVLIHIA